MKCTNKFYRKRRNRKRELIIRLACLIGVVILGVIAVFFLLSSKEYVIEYEKNTYSSTIYETSFFAENLCVTAKEQEFEEFRTNDVFHGSLLFNIDTNEVLLSQQANEKLYPASTTKIMTAYLALKYGNLQDTVTVSENATKIPSDSSKAWLEAGDRLSLEDLLYSLMLPSGNDSAVAIAEHISGTTEEFANLMNEEARKLGATNSHFVNPHGYHDEEHYTTAYDLYLIFNEAIKNETFVDIISRKTWSGIITSKNGSERKATWSQTNQFINGTRTVPKDVKVIGGKTGNTFKAGSCLVLYVKGADNTPYISIIMGATSKRNLYDNMTFLLTAIPNE